MDSSVENPDSMSHRYNRLTSRYPGRCDLETESTEIIIAPIQEPWLYNLHQLDHRGKYLIMASYRNLSWPIYAFNESYIFSLISFCMFSLIFHAYHMHVLPAHFA